MLVEVAENESKRRQGDELRRAGGRLPNASPTKRRRPGAPGSRKAEIGRRNPGTVSWVRYQFGNRYSSE
jgi:hypothetical protein